MAYIYLLSFPYRWRYCPFPFSHPLHSLTYITHQQTNMAASRLATRPGMHAVQPSFWGEALPTYIRWVFPYPAQKYIRRERTLPYPNLWPSADPLPWGSRGAIAHPQPKGSSGAMEPSPLWGSCGAIAHPQHWGSKPRIPNLRLANPTSWGGSTRTLHRTQKTDNSSRGSGGEAVASGLQRHPYTIPATPTLRHVESHPPFYY